VPGDAEFLLVVILELVIAIVVVPRASTPTSRVLGH
jgi:hypothetical protein